MSLKDRLFNDMKIAMKNKQRERVSTIRMARAAIINEEKSKARDLNDNEVIEILNREVKKRKDSIKEFEKGDRPDLIEKEKNEIQILLEYLPEQMSEEEIAVLVKEKIGELKASSPRDIGRVMGKIMPELKGKADGSVVKRDRKSVV